MSSSFYSQIGIPSANSTAIESNVATSQTAATNSAASATNSASSASASAASATAANAADVSATQSKNAAETAETNSAASAALSATSSAAAVTAKTASETAKTASELAATNASTSETNAAASATSAASSLAAIGTSVTNSAASATAAASTLATFQNQYLGAASTAPTLDPDGSALDLGDLWFDTASDTLKVYASGGWVNAGSSVNGTSERQTYTATAGQTTFAVTYDAGFVDCWMNGSKLLVGSDFTATSGTNIVLASGASAGDIIDIVAFGTFALSTHYTKTAADARFEPIDSAYTKVEADARYIQSGGSGSYADSDVDTHLNQSTATSGKYLKWNGSDYAWDVVPAGVGGATGVDFNDNTKARFGTGNDLEIYHDGSNSYISDQGTNDLKILATDLQIKNAADNEFMMTAVTDGAVTLYYDNAAKLATTSTGVGVTGTVSATGVDITNVGTASASGTNFIIQQTNSNGVFQLKNHDSTEDIEFGQDYFRIKQGGSERMRIRDNGNVGIGTAAPLRQLSLASTSNAEMSFISGTSSNASILFGDGLTGTDVYKGYVQYEHANDAMTFATVSAERMRLKSDGQIRMGDTNTQPITYTGANALMTEIGTVFGNQAISIAQGSFTGAYNVLYFRNGNGECGYIQTNGSSTTYSTGSDYRLKENVTSISNGITRLKQLKPSRFNFIADADKTLDGFLAHEAQAVVPEAVTGTKDAVQVWKEHEKDKLPDGVSVGDNKLDDDGNTIPEIQGIDQSKIVPLLTAALQEAIAKIETLESENTTQATQIADLITRVTALEAN